MAVVKKKAFGKCQLNKARQGCGLPVNLEFKTRDKISLITSHSLGFSFVQYASILIHWMIQEHLWASLICSAVPF